MKSPKKKPFASVNLGRWPFKAGIKYFVDARTPYCTPITIQEDSRKLRYFAEVLDGLYLRGKLTTTDPRHMCREDIEAFIVWMKEKNLVASTRTKYLVIMNHYLRTWGNTVIIDMKNEGNLRMPRDTEKAPIRALRIADLERILESTYQISGWRGEVIRGIIALGFGTGCRPKELFFAEIADLDLANARFYIRHPKGEGSWGQSQWIPIIRGDMLPLLESLLEARRGLKGPAAVSKYLFVNERSSEAYNPNTIRMIKAETERISGIQWKIKDLRSTLASVTIQGDVSKLKAVSLQLRHATVVNTEKYYARISSADEIRSSIGESWKHNPVNIRKSNDVQ